jgi:hypothetical protein
MTGSAAPGPSGADRSGCATGSPSSKAGSASPADGGTLVAADIPLPG